MKKLTQLKFQEVEVMDDQEMKLVVGGQSGNSGSGSGSVKSCNLNATTLDQCVGDLTGINRCSDYDSNGEVMHGTCSLFLFGGGVGSGLVLKCGCKIG